MSSICFYFQIHQPLRINPKARNLNDLFHGARNSKLNNKEVLSKVVEKCYLPATKLILDLIKKYPKFKASFSITGVLLDQLESDFPEVIELFKQLAKTGRVEFLNETYYHSLSSLYSKKEFIEQIEIHKTKMRELFDVETTTFRNTELIYSDSITKIAKSLGFNTIVAEGADRILKWRSPNHLYKSTSGTNLLLKNYKLSDDIAFKFSDWKWADFPMTADKYIKRVNAINSIGDEIVNLFMDYETFGEHQWEVTGIFEFFKYLIKYVEESQNDFVLPSEASVKFKPKKKISMKDYVSWADIERDTSAWNSNKMQQDSLNEIYSLETKVKTQDNPDILRTWRYLLTSDHFYYMSTKNYDGDLDDQAVHNYFSPYGTPYDAHNAYQNALRILKSAL